MPLSLYKVRKKLGKLYLMIYPFSVKQETMREMNVRKV